MNITPEILDMIRQDGYRLAAQKLGTSKSNLYGAVKFLGGLTVDPKRLTTLKAEKLAATMEKRRLARLNKKPRGPKKVYERKTDRYTRSRGECDCGNPCRPGMDRCVRCTELEMVEWTRPTVGRGRATYQTPYKVNI